MFLQRIDKMKIEVRTVWPCKLIQRRECDITFLLSNKYEVGERVVNSKNNRNMINYIKYFSEIIPFFLQLKLSHWRIHCIIMSTFRIPIDGQFFMIRKLSSTPLLSGHYWESGHLPQVIRENIVITHWLANPTIIAHLDCREEVSGRIILGSSDLLSITAPSKKITSSINHASQGFGGWMIYSGL